MNTTHTEKAPAGAGTPCRGEENQHLNRQEKETVMPSVVETVVTAEATEPAQPPTASFSPLITPIEAVDQRIAALAREREQLISQLLADLEWMGTRVLRIRPVFMPLSLRDSPVGTRVHAIHQYAEADSYESTSVHSTTACDRFCGGKPGVVVKGGGRERWRFRFDGAFEYIGVHDCAPGGTEYLFMEVTA